MNVDARESQMIGNAIDDAPCAAFLTRYPCELTVCIIERVRADMTNHARDVDAEVTVKIKMSGNDPEDSGQQTYGRRRHLQLREKRGQAEPYDPVKTEIQDSLDFARFKSRFDPGGCRLNHFCRH